MTYKILYDLVSANLPGLSGHLPQAPHALSLAAPILSTVASLWNVCLFLSTW